MKKIAFLSGMMFSASVFGMTYSLDKNPGKSSGVLQPISEKYVEYLEQNITQLQEKNSSLEERIRSLMNRVEELEKEYDVTENHIGRVKEEYGNLKGENEKLTKTVSEQNQKIKNLQEVIEESNQYIEKSDNEYQQLLAITEKLIRENKQLSAENQQLRKSMSLDDSEISISEIVGATIADEIQGEDILGQDDSTEVVKISDSENTKNPKKNSFDKNDWGIFFKEPNDSEDCLHLKGDSSFLIKSDFVGDAFSLSRKNDYVKFGFEFWYNLVEFRLVDDARGEFSLSKSDFSNRRSKWDCLPGCLLWISSPSDYLILTKEFIYKGEAKNSDTYGKAPHGAGAMLKNTGEVLIGEFEEGEYKGGGSQ